MKNQNARRRGSPPGQPREAQKEPARSAGVRVSSVELAYMAGFFDRVPMIAELKRLKRIDQGAP